MKDEMVLKIEEVQKLGVKILGAVADVCKEKDIPYIGYYGTLLGAIRHGGPIPWDYDIDIGVPMNRYEEFLSAMENDLPDEYWLEYRQSGYMKKALPRVGLKGYITSTLHVDVFPIIGVPEDERKRKKLYKQISRVSSLRSAKEYHYYKGKKKILADFCKYGLFFITPDMLIRKFDKLCNKYPYESSSLVGCGVEAITYKCAFPKELLEEATYVDYSGIELRVPKDYEKVLTTLYGDYKQFPPEEERNKFLNRTYVIYERKN